MTDFIVEFRKYCIERNWSFDNHTSEFTFQFRVCRFLEAKNKARDIELESNIQRYNFPKLIKKEIDIDFINIKGEKIAMELKFVRDMGSFNIGMFKFCEDVKFLEQLVECGFNLGFAIIFTTIEKIYTRSIKELKPKNPENTNLYRGFRENFQISGSLSIKTGNLNQSIILKGKYDLNWEDFLGNIKVCVVKV
jgi:hypothetical protein